jgi:hypothetical protein
LRIPSSFLPCLTRLKIRLPRAIRHNRAQPLRRRAQTAQPVFDAAGQQRPFKAVSLRARQKLRPEEHQTSQQWNFEFHDAHHFLISLSWREVWQPECQTGRELRWRRKLRKSKEICNGGTRLQGKSRREMDDDLSARAEIQAERWLERKNSTGFHQGGCGGLLREKNDFAPATTAGPAR